MYVTEDATTSTPSRQSKPVLYTCIDGDRYLLTDGRAVRGTKEVKGVEKDAWLSEVLPHIYTADADPVTGTVWLASWRELRYQEFVYKKDGEVGVDADRLPRGPPRSIEKWAQQPAVDEDDGAVNMLVWGCSQAEQVLGGVSTEQATEVSGRELAKLVAKLGI